MYVLAPKLVLPLGEYYPSGASAREQGAVLTCCKALRLRWCKLKQSFNP